jgi:hypothetical protein
LKRHLQRKPKGADMSFLASALAAIREALKTNKVQAQPELTGIANEITQAYADPAKPAAQPAQPKKQKSAEQLAYEEQLRKKGVIG